jgi:hypothetical protein
MRLIGKDRDCGPLLDLGELQRQLRLGTPVVEGLATIRVAHIIGSVTRAQDFDGCFRPRREHLDTLLRHIVDADPATLDDPIDVVRVDRAYFVADGHKRVAIAHQTGREFIDANVSRVRSPYALTSGVEADAIERTAREGEFRRHTGLAEAVPDARFPLADVAGYGELREAVQTFAYESGLARGRIVPPAEAAADWYESTYLPVVAMGRRTVGGLIDSCTDADVFLAMHRHSRASWGTECDAVECAADMLLAERRRTANERSLVAAVVARARGGDRTPSLLPLADASTTRDDATP